MNKTKTTKRALLSSVLALFLCFTMLLGTTYAWFTDTVSSEGNVIQTGELKVAFDWADGSNDPANTTWTDASEGAIFDYTNWEPGYAVARHLRVSNVGTLALNYQMRIVANGTVTKLADVIDVYYFAEDEALVRDDIAGAQYLGTLTEIIGTEKSFTKTAKGSLKPGDASDIHTIVLKMKEEAGNEYQNMDLGCTFSVQLTATQMSYEKDSFDEKYDEFPGNDVVPSALVKDNGKQLISYTLGIGGEVKQAYLDTSMQFQPTMSLEEALLCEYQLWHADFVVYADADVPAESLMLAGYYDAWCQYNDDNWVGLTAGEDIPANTKIRLVETLGVTVNWEDLCRYGNDGIGFLCGATDLTGVNAGTTLTVELRLYKVGAQGECSTGGGCKHPYVECELGSDEYITAGKFVYTFPAYEVESQEELNAALDAGIPNISVPAGEYTFPSNKLSEGTTLYCEEGTVFTGTSSLNIDGATVVGATFSNPNGSVVSQTINGTFKDCTFTGSNGLRMCYAGETVVFENCVFDGSVYGVHFDGGANEIIFKNCTISGFNATAAAIEKVTFEGCTFVANGKSNYNGVNSWGSTDYINCTFVFDGTAGNEWVHLRTAGKTMTFTNCVVVGGGQLTDYIEKPDGGIVIIDGVELN